LGAGRNVAGDLDGPLVVSVRAGSAVTTNQVEGLATIVRKRELALERERERERERQRKKE